MNKENLLDFVEKNYGFKRELIKNPEKRGLAGVSFVVNGIKYFGHFPFHGAVPHIYVEGYTALHCDEHSIPVEDWYYDEFIKGKPAQIFHCVDREIGEWEDTGIRLKSQEEAQEYINSLDDREKDFYKYEMIQDGDNE